MISNQNPFNPLMHNVPRFAARFLKSVRPFWDIVHERGRDLNTKIHMLSCYCTKTNQSLLSKRYLIFNFLELKKLAQSRPLITLFRNQSICK